MIVIIGAGVIGLGIAWRASQRGLPVTLVDPAPGSGASHVAAGMLTPVGELQYGEEDHLRLGIDSRDRYPAFAAELAELTGVDVGHRAEGNLSVAYDGDDLAFLREQHEFQSSLGLRTELLTGRECRRLEPMLAPSVRGGILAPDDGSVDPRKVLRALTAACAGIPVVRQRAREILVEDGRAKGVLLEDGQTLGADQVVLAAGSWSGGLSDLPVRPVKGQIIRLRSPYPFLTRATRGLVQGFSMYLVPRPDGELVIGATQEEMGFDGRVTAGGLWELLRDARALFPGVTELEFTEVTASFRPGSPDNAPILGPSAVRGLLYATGHYRNGVLLAPLTADALADVLAGGDLPEVARPFTAARFAPLESR
ncbi:glycine oxidase ThiO [Actinocorallia sp. API 0066]|uniref:glycine oxidase ThiO n=1 Tax=Actinocorallia sp. API 0066 TaxID=2896846 RepID=UPI001E2F4644|nr:glycine oxidase ThiO [Actinocorallia sp. API 0066]MCD0450955.1 glycine oxidase ThiO [Actinocorallia sp. API 0066]